MLRGAVIGCGRISEHHAGAIEAVPGARIVAVCDLDRRLAEDLAERHAVADVFGDAGEMLAATRPDVVHILTPPGSHLQLARLAAAAGTNMYVEKPLAQSLGDARAIFEAAAAAGVSVCAGHSRVFDPPFRAACERLRRGEIGRLLSVRAEQGFTYDPSAHSAAIPWDHTYDWGILENLIPHPLALLCHLLEEPGDPQVVALAGDAVREAAVEEIRAVIPAINASGELCFSLGSPETNRVELVGTEGRLLVDFNALSVLVSKRNGLPAAINRFGGNFATAAKLAGASGEVAAGLATRRIRRYMGIRALVAAFYESVAAGAAPPVPVQHALSGVRLMEQIREASRPAAKQRDAGTPSTSSRQRAPTVLVTGGSGFLGGRLVERLALGGGGIRATARLSSRARAVDGVEWTVCELTQPAMVARAVEGIETVYHCAAMAGAPGTLEDYDRANTEGTLRLLEACRDAGASTLVYVSTLSVYGLPPEGEEWVDERAAYDHRAAERGVYTQSKLRAEKAVLEYAARHQRPRVVVIRPGLIYGPGSDPPAGLFQLPSGRGRPLVAGRGRTPIALTYIDNVIDAMLAAAAGGQLSGTVYDVVDSPELDQAELWRELRRCSHGRIRPIPVPYAVVWGLMLAVDAASLLRHGSPGSARYRLRRTLAPMRFGCQRARTELGWRPLVSLSEGLEATLEGQSR